MLVASTRLHISGLALVLALSLGFPTAAAADLPGGYSAQPLSSPAIAAGDSYAGERFGESLVSVGDLNGDRSPELAVGAPGAPVNQIFSTITGRVYLIDGASGAALWKADQPNPPAHVGAPTDFGARVVLLGDIGQCSSSGSACQFSNELDRFPEVVVSAPGEDLNSAEGADQGGVYVLDGATGRILKRLLLGADNLPPSGSGGSGFGKALLVPAGAPACQGNGGIGACPSLTERVAIGDLDGGGKPDIVIGAPDFTDTADNPSACTEEQVQCPGAGRVFIYTGEKIAGSSLTPVDTPASAIAYFEHAGAGAPAHFGSDLAPLGDIGSCDAGEATVDARCYGSAGGSTPSNEPDGAPDFLAAAAGADGPGGGSSVDAGAAFVIEGRLGTATTKLENPAGAGRLVVSGGGAPIGDVGGSALMDVAVGAPGFGAAEVGQGAAWAFDGDVEAAGGLASIGRLDDPAPVAQGSFGAVLAAIGDVAGDAQGELAVGRGPAAAAVYLFSACKASSLQRIDDPSAQAGSGFGSAIVPIGDANSDGFLDLAVAAPGLDGAQADQGAVYRLLSNGSEGPAFSGCNPSTGGGGRGGGGTGPGTGTGTGTGSGTVFKRTRRTVGLVASRRVVKAGRSVKLHGSIRTGRSARLCRARQKIAVQRLVPGTRFFQTFDVAVSGNDGRFSLRTKPGKTYTYRLRLSQSNRCEFALSRTTRVVVAGAR